MREPSSEMALNPFSTRCVQPGAAEYLFPAGHVAPQLVDRLRALGWWAQIVGPHGSGKSTLLHALRPHLEACGRRVESCHLQAGQTQLPWGAEHARQWTECTQLVIDGYEQLGWPARWWLRRCCRTRGAGGLVSTHRPLRLPVLWRTEATLAVAQQLVARLVPRPLADRITEDDVARAYAAHPGNLRETLFALYDLFEQRRERSCASHVSRL
jgi:hypothetical protein